MRQDLRQWISAPDPSVNYNAACDAHHEGTSTWCGRSNAFTDWNASGSLLWIHGKRTYHFTLWVLITTNSFWYWYHSWLWEERSKVRCSTSCVTIEHIELKSSTSSVIIRDIKTMSNAGLVYLAYFYFDFKDKAKQDPRALLSSLLVQLSDQSDQFCDVLLQVYSAHKDGSEQPSNASLARCLKNMFAIAGQAPIYLIIDALDECPSTVGVPSSREKVLDLVEEFVELRHLNLRIFVTSRPEFDICTVLGPLATQQLTLQNESGQTQDIIYYVTSVVRSDKRMKRWKDEAKDMVIEKLTEKADGM
jgi:hypothetical protein